MSHRAALRRLLALALLSGVGLPGCSGKVTYQEAPAPGEFTQRTSNLSTAKKRERATKIKRVAVQEGLANPVLLAGIAEAETNFAHCWSEATWACKGPHSSTCGGPVIAGSGDGPCSQREGGLGLFQFDGGTYDETLQRDGRQVLNLQGNVRHAVEFVADMVRDSNYISGVETRAEALEWMNRVDIGGTQYATWIKTVTAHYNGCVPGHCSIYRQRYNHYDNAHRRIYSSLGADFWSSSQTTDDQSAPAAPQDVRPNWAQTDNAGTVDLKWSEVAGADSYAINMEVNSGDGWEHYYEWETDRPPFRVWPQSEDSYYRWRLKTCNLSGCSDWTDWRAFAVGAAETNADLEGYNSGNSTNDDTQNNDTQNDDTQDTETDETASESSETPSDSVATGPPAAPTARGPHREAVRSERVDLTWSKVEDADNYVVNMRRWDPQDRQWRHYYTWSNVGGSLKSIWPVHNRHSYAWRVRACGGETCSGWSRWSVFYLYH